MKVKLQFFGIGLFIAGLIFTVFTEFSLPFGISDSTHSEDVSSLKNELAASKAEVEKLKEAIALAENSTNENIETEATEETATSEQDPTGEEVTSTFIEATIFIYEDLSIYDIGKQAEDLKLVKNGRELELFLSKREYARSIQKGQFELNSSMSIEEIANIITGKE